MTGRCVAIGRAALPGNPRCCRNTLRGGVYPTHANPARWSGSPWPAQILDTGVPNTGSATPAFDRGHAHNQRSGEARVCRQLRMPRHIAPRIGVRGVELRRDRRLVDGLVAQHEEPSGTQDQSSEVGSWPEHRRDRMPGIQHGVIDCELRDHLGQPAPLRLPLPIPCPGPPCLTPSPPALRLPGSWLLRRRLTPSPFRG
mgnify:CR=1 FL=1